MLRTRPFAILAVVAVAALIAGCGGAVQNDDSADDFQGDQRAAAKVIEDLESAITRSRVPDAKKICTKLITQDLARRIASQERDGNCEDRLEESLKDIKLGGGVPELTVLKVRVSGDRATASVKAANDDRDATSDYALVRSGAAWRISAF